jgi:hypothetical protein
MKLCQILGSHIVSMDMIVMQDVMPVNFSDKYEAVHQPYSVTSKKSVMYVHTDLFCHVSNCEGNITKQNNPKSKAQQQSVK